MDLSRIQELLDCPVCFKPLRNSSKVLPCQHTFCKRCLKNIASTKGFLQCPECRSVFSETSIESLPPNVFLERLVGELHRTDQPGDQQAILWKWQGMKDYQIQPSAKALYDFARTDEGDLPFAKGDIILLTDVLDENWYEGVLEGRKGTIPANFIQITVPFPTVEEVSQQEPYAKALYDFDKSEEKYMLTFKKGDIIAVIKKINDNWGEGTLKDQHGIFPLNYVELNAAAEVRIANSESTDEESDYPEQKTAEDAARSDAAESHQVNEQAAKRHTIHVDNPDELKTVRSKRQLGYSVNYSRCRDRRASETSVQETLSKLSSLKTSCSSDDVLNGVANTTAPTSRVTSQTSTETRQGSYSSSSLADSSDNLYICFRNFESQKPDELSLQRGEVYYVKNKFQDGWFSGYHVGSEKNGVFPGNYVQQISNDQPRFCRSLSSNQTALLSTVNLPARLTSLHATSPLHAHSSSAPASMTQFSPRGSHISPVRPSRPLQRVGRPRTGSEPIDPSTRRKKEKPKLGLGSLFRNLKKKTAMPDPALPPYRTTTQLETWKLRRPIPVLPTEPPPPYSPPLIPLPPPRSPNSDLRTIGMQNCSRYRAVISFPSQHENELELVVGDILFVTNKREDGWYYGQSQRTGRVGLFPSSFAESF